MDFNFSFVVKEEILRNLLKAHKNVLIVGKIGTGKTTTALKVAKESGEVFYYSAKNEIHYSLATDSSIKLVVNTEELANPQSENPIIIADDINSASPKIQEQLLTLISDKQSKGKKILIANFLVELKPFLSAVDVVVRFKADTAQMVFTEVVDIGKI